MPTIYAGHQFQGAMSMAIATLTGSNPIGIGILDGIQRMTYDYNKSISVIKECGNSYVYGFLPGVITITGTIERAYTGSSILGMIRGLNETGSIPVQPLFADETTGPHIGFYPSGHGTGQPYIVFAKVAFAGHRLTARPGNNLTTEVIDFYAKKMWTGSVG